MNSIMARAMLIGGGVPAAAAGAVCALGAFWWGSSTALAVGVGVGTGLVAMALPALVLAVASAVGVLATWLFAAGQLGPVWFDKFRMPAGYLLLSLAVQTLLFAAIRR